MRYRIVYQQEPLITTYRYCSYMMQVGTLLQVWLPNTSKYRIEVLDSDGNYHNCSAWSPKQEVKQ